MGLVRHEISTSLSIYIDSNKRFIVLYYFRPLPPDVSGDVHYSHYYGHNYPYSASYYQYYGSHTAPHSSHDHVGVVKSFFYQNIVLSLQFKVKPFLFFCAKIMIEKVSYDIIVLTTTKEIEVPF